MEYSRISKFIFNCVQFCFSDFFPGSLWRDVKPLDEGLFLVSDARSFRDVLRTGKEEPMDVSWSSSVAVYNKFDQRKDIFHLDIQKTYKNQKLFLKSSSIAPSLWFILGNL